MYVYTVGIYIDWLHAFKTLPVYWACVGGHSDVEPDDSVRSHQTDPLVFLDVYFKFPTDAHHSPTLVKGNCPLSLLARLMTTRLYRNEVMCIYTFRCGTSPLPWISSNRFVSVSLFIIGIVRVRKGAFPK